MANTKDNKYYISKILNDINAIIEYTKNLSRDEFIGNSLIIDATMFRLVQMTENVKGLSEEFRNNHSSVKWTSIVGFRNKIVHEYGKTDYSIVYEIISKDIYKLKIEL